MDLRKVVWRISQEEMQHLGNRLRLFFLAHKIIKKTTCRYSGHEGVKEGYNTLSWKRIEEVLLIMIMIIWEKAVFYITISHHFSVITRHIVTGTSSFHSVFCAGWDDLDGVEHQKTEKKARQWNGHGFGRTINWLFLWDETHSINWVLLVLITGISGHNCRAKKTTWFGTEHDMDVDFLLFLPFVVAETLDGL